MREFLTISPGIRGVAYPADGAAADCPVTSTNHSGRETTGARRKGRPLGRGRDRQRDVECERRYR